MELSGLAVGEAKHDEKSKSEDERDNSEKRENFGQIIVKTLNNVNVLDHRERHAESRRKRIGGTVPTPRA